MARIVPGILALLIVGSLCACGEARSDAIWKEVIGTNHLLRGNAEEAVKKLREAVNADPTYTAARINLGMALIESSTSEYAAAKEQYALAIKETESRSGISSLIPFLDVVAYRSHPRYSEEVRRISLGALNNMGAQQYEQAEFQAARKTLQSASDLFDESRARIPGFDKRNGLLYARIACNQGLTLADLANLAESRKKANLRDHAIAHYTKAIKTLKSIGAEETFPDPYLWRAFVLKAKGGEAAKSADKDYERYIELGGAIPIKEQYIKDDEKPEVE